MSASKKLFKNIGIFAISNFASKGLIFLMLPLYTRAMTTTDLGKSDMIITATALVLPLFSLGVYNGVLRFSIREGSDKPKIFSYGLKIIIIGFLLLLLLFPVLIKVDMLKEYLIYFYIIYIMNCLNMYFNQFLRGLDKLKLIGVVGVIAALVTVIGNVLLLVVFKMGARGYLISYALVNTVSVSILFFGGKLYKYFTIKKIDNALKKDMKNYNLPLIPNSLSWWMILMLNRYIINYFIGAGAVGVFTVANKIPTIINVLYSIIQQALLLSVITDYEEGSKNPIFKSTYKVINVLLLICVIMFSIFIRPMAPILFGKSFYSAWEITPLLMFSVFFGSLHGTLTIAFSANKRTKILLYNGLIGVVVCITTNLTLTQYAGIKGTAIASLITYFAVWLHLFIVSKRLKFIDINIVPDLLCYAAVLSAVILIPYVSEAIYYITFMVSLLMVVIIKYKFIKVICKNLYNFVSKYKLFKKK
jgi:O-antigen/teichoic acid export membrane protein